MLELCPAKNTLYRVGLRDGTEQTSVRVTQAGDSRGPGSAPRGAAGRCGECLSTAVACSSAIKLGQHGVRTRLGAAKRTPCITHLSLRGADREGGRGKKKEMPGLGIEPRLPEYL